LARVVREGVDKYRFFLTLYFGYFEPLSQASLLKATKIQNEEKTVFVNPFPYYLVIFAKRFLN